jgi:transcriptional regulator with XRE-family HTH domain
MQQRHIWNKKMQKKSVRIPKGYAKLRDDLGKILKSARLNYDEGTGCTQTQLAERVGISRESLSRIENGRVPVYETLCDLMIRLGLKWDDVAIEGESSGSSYHYSPEYRHFLGESLRKGRRAVGLTLRDLAAEVGISFSQLSRIERAQSTRSALIKVRDTGCDRNLDECIFEFSNERLKKLADRGGMC